LRVKERSCIEEGDDSKLNMNEELSQLEKYIQSLKRTKLQKDKGSNMNEPKITIRSRVQIDRGSVNLPKDVIIEALYNNNGISLSFKNNNGRGDFYYKCFVSECPYTLRIRENKTLSNFLSSATLLGNFKSFDISKHSDLEDGICTLTEFGEHKYHPPNYEELSKQAFEKKR